MLHLYPGRGRWAMRQIGSGGQRRIINSLIILSYQPIGIKNDILYFKKNYYIFHIVLIRYTHNNMYILYYHINQ